MTAEHREKENLWTREELVAATGGELVLDGEIDDIFGRVVFPLALVKSGSVVIHTDGSWPDRAKRDSGQTDKSLDDVIDVGQKRGAALVVASEPTERPSAPPILPVENTYRAFLALARAALRDQCTCNKQGRTVKRHLRQPDL